MPATLSQRCDSTPDSSLFIIGNVSFNRRVQASFLIKAINTHTHTHTQIIKSNKNEMPLQFRVHVAFHRDMNVGGGMKAKLTWGFSRWSAAGRGPWPGGRRKTSAQTGSTRPECAPCSCKCPARGPGRTSEPPRTSPSSPNSTKILHHRNQVPSVQPTPSIPLNPSG